MNTSTPDAPALVLVVEDEPHIRQFVSSALRQEGCTVIEAASAATAMTQMQQQPRLLLLDLGLPDGDGIQFIKELRLWSGVPIMVLSARAAENQKIDALDAGADDYLTKPFGIGELRARVRAMLRRQATLGNDAIVEFGAIRIDHIQRSITRHGELIHLTPIEYRLLSVLLGNVGKVLTQRYLLREVWGVGHAERSHYLRIYISHLRQKLEIDPARPQHLLTETGIGYRFQIEP